MRDLASTAGVHRDTAYSRDRSLTLLSYVWSDVASVNNELSPIDPGAEWQQCGEDIITEVLGIESPAF